MPDSDHSVALALGSNISDRDEHLDSALRQLSNILLEPKESTRYETKPQYRTDQPDFLNSVVVGHTTLAPESLILEIRKIEIAEGRDRRRAGRMGPRPIDIDILLFGDQIVGSADLTIPHPRMRERKFVLLPLLELLPFAIDPVSGRRFWDIFEELPRQGIYYHRMESLASPWG